MASKLLVIKQTRPSLDVPFFTPTAEAKASMKSEPLPIVAGERNIDGGLKKIRTLFFTTAQSYADWQASESMQSNIAARNAYNAANGIVTEMHTVDMPNYNPFRAPVL
jgi:hypothetical protein